jgi:hypothetical protein
MEPDKSTARTIGVLVLLHLLIGLMAPFMILHSVTGPRGFLFTAAQNAVQLRTAVFLLFIGSAMAIAVSVAAFTTFRRYSLVMALWLVALAVAAFSLQAVDNGRLLAMLTLSQEYTSSGSANPELFQTLAVVVGSARKWAHYTYLFVAVSWIFLLFKTFYRFRLVPRALAGFGILGALLQIAGVTVRAICGYGPETRLAMPLAPAYIGLALWLMVKGFDEREKSVQT